MLEIRDKLKKRSDGAARKASRQREWRSLPFLDARDWLMLERIRALLEAEARLPRHRLSEDELVFDRLLLACSRHYRRTRELAHRIGIRLAPQLQTIERALDSFDPSLSVLPYSPLSSELAWLLASGRRDDRALEAIKALRGHVTSIYHDLNHAIFFSLARPAGTRSLAESRRYYSWVESMVAVREIELAEELGNLGVPLHAIGVMYWALPESLEFAAEAMSHRKFVELQPFFYFENCGFSASRIRGAYRRAGIGLPDHPLRASSPVFLRETSPRWFANHARKAGAGIARPRLPRARSFPLLRFEVKSPSCWLHEERQLRAAYAWYTRLFALPRIR